MTFAQNAQKVAVPAEVSLSLDEAMIIIMAAYDAQPVAMKQLHRWWKERHSKGCSPIRLPPMKQEVIMIFVTLGVLVPLNKEKKNSPMEPDHRLWQAIELLQVNGTPIRGKEDEMPASVSPGPISRPPSSRRSGSSKPPRDERYTSADLRFLARNSGTYSLDGDDDDDNEPTLVMSKSEIGHYVDQVSGPPPTAAEQSN